MPAPALVDELAEGVELQLPGGLVSDPHRRGAAPALEPFHLLLAEPALAADAEENLQVLGVAGGAALDEAAELVGVALAAELGQRAHGHRRVAHPAVAVVPVALAAQLAHLRQRGGRGGGDRAGRLVGEGFQGQRGAHRAGEGVDHLALRAAPPLAPPLFGPAEAGVDRAGVERVEVLQRVELDRPPVGELEPAPLALADRRLAAQHVAAVELEPDLAAQDQPVVAADRREDPAVLAGVAQPGLHLAVVEARLEVDAKLERAGEALDDAQDARDSPRVRRRREEVEQPRLAALAAQRVSSTIVPSR